MNTRDPELEEPEELDRTVVVPRAASGRRAAKSVEEPAPDDTALVRRSGSSVPGTEATGSPEEPDDDVTVAVGEPRVGGPRRSRPRAAVLIPVRLPNGTEASTRASAGPGPGLRERYEPRAIPAPPAPAEAREAGPEASRLAAPAMPSVVRASRRAGLVTILALAAAVVLSVAGLIWVVQTLSAG